MHVQMMPVLISTVDQMDMSVWSKVGFVEPPRSTMNWSRMMLTTVTLSVKSGTGPLGGGDRTAGIYSQGADQEHGGHADLLLPVEFETADLRQRDANHPDIQRDTDGRIRPADRVQVDAVLRP